MTQSRAKPIAIPRSARLPPTYIGFSVHVNMPLVASAIVGFDGRAFVPMLWKRLLAPITIPMPIAKAMAPTTIRTKNRTWASRPRGIKKLRTTPTTRTESGISGGKITTFGVSREVSVLASFVAPGVFSSTNFDYSCAQINLVQIRQSCERANRCSTLSTMALIKLMVPVEAAVWRLA